ncbi:MAG: hypothetical protein IKW39_06170 [Alphaproteobacteria bacterium]|nr:hypothetical protein [Alphaproteobacteria bacterium]
MKRIIMLMMCFIFVCLLKIEPLKAQQKVSESVYQLNDSTMLYETTTTDVIFDVKQSNKNRNYKLKIPKVVDFNVKSLSKENEIFVWIKVVSVKRAVKGYQNLSDGLKNDISVWVEQYDVIPKDSVF